MVAAKKLNKRPQTAKKPVGEWNDTTNVGKYFDINVDVKEKRLADTKRVKEERNTRIATGNRAEILVK